MLESAGGGDQWQRHKTVYGHLNRRAAVIRGSTYTAVNIHWMLSDVNLVESVTYETLSVLNMVSPSSKSIVLEARLMDHSARFESSSEEGIAYALEGSTCRTLQTRSRYNISVNK